MLPEEEVEGLLSSSGSHPTARRGPSRLVAVGVTAGLLALVGLLAFAGSPPAHSNGRVAVAPPAVTVLEEEKKDDPEPPTAASAKMDWDAGDVKGAMDLERGEMYWVATRHSAGWTYAYAYDYSEEGWVPDTLLYHGAWAVVRKAYKNNEVSVEPGDYVLVLDKQTSKTGPNWLYVLVGKDYGWIDEKAVKADDHPRPCFVKDDFKVEDAGQLDLKQGEVVFAAKITDPTASWVSVENSKYRKGYVPRKHLIENPEQAVLQTFGADEEAASKETPPKPVLHVKEGTAVWVDEKHSPSEPKWLYAYIGEKQGYVPKWALLEVKVDGENTFVGEGTGDEPDNSAANAADDAKEDAGSDAGPEEELPEGGSATTKETSATTKEPAATTKEPATTAAPATTKEPDADDEEPKGNTTTAKSEEVEGEKVDKDAKDDSDKKEE